MLKTGRKINKKIFYTALQLNAFLMFSAEGHFTERMNILEG